MEKELKENYKMREEWFLKAKDFLQKNIFESWEIPEGTKISCGDLDKKHKGCCFAKEVSEKGFTEIFISPSISEEIEVLGTLSHELIHAYLGPGKRHGKEFKEIAEKIGLLSPWTASTEGPIFKENIKTFIEELGKYPHSKINRKTMTKETKSKTRMYICSKDHEEWKCLVKEKYFLQAKPVCPICGETMVWEEKNSKSKIEVKVTKNPNNEEIFEINNI